MHKPKTKKNQDATLHRYVLCDILSLGLIGEHAVGDADHARIFGPEKSLERR